MRTSALALLGAAALVAAADLAHKALAMRDPAAVPLHDRSAMYALVLAAALLWAVALVAVRSPLLALAGGVVAGGAAGNVLSLALWPGVPDPLVSGALAFNLADVAALAGGLVLVPLAVLALMARGADLRRPVGLR